MSLLAREDLQQYIEIIASNRVQVYFMLWTFIWVVYCPQSYIVLKVEIK